MDSKNILTLFDLNECVNVTQEIVKNEIIIKISNDYRNFERLKKGFCWWKDTIKARTNKSPLNFINFMIPPLDFIGPILLFF